MDFSVSVSLGDFLIVGSFIVTGFGVYHRLANRLTVVETKLDIVLAPLKKSHCYVQSSDAFEWKCPYKDKE